MRRSEDMESVEEGGETGNRIGVLVHMVLCVVVCVFVVSLHSGSLSLSRCCARSL